jgi:hypothetical protein
VSGCLTTIAAGTCAGTPVFWTADGEVATILIGPDDETWDVAVPVPVEVVEQIAAKAASRDVD